MIHGGLVTAIWGHVVNIGLGNGLLPEGAKSLSEPTLTYQ